MNQEMMFLRKEPQNTCDKSFIIVKGKGGQKKLYSSKRSIIAQAKFNNMSPLGHPNG